MEIKISSGVVSYRKTGNGDRNIVLFHGFRQNHMAFDAILPELEKKYTVYSFDLFFHGMSTWEDQNPITPANWKEIFSQFLTINAIKSFDMMAFSIGSRFLFTTLALFPSHVSRIFLIAPDGIQISSWYKTATCSSVSRKFFKYVLNSPKVFANIAKFASSLKLVDPLTVRLIERQLQSAQNRTLVYNTWVLFRKLIVPLNQLVNTIEHHHIEVYMLVAQHDTIIPYDRIKPLKNALPNVQVKQVDASHHQLLRAEFLNLLPF
jgi:pimeloyl-ACP methyl ester carboxylesterase